MALPELIANSPTPGVREQLTTLAVELSEAGLELELAAKLPTALQATGQTRLVIDHEIILVEGTSSTKVKVIARGAEGSIKVAHVAGAKVYHLLTAEALKLLRGGEGNVAIAYRKAVLKVPNSTFTRVKVDTIVKDPGSNINLTEGYYTCPTEGYYAVYGIVATNSMNPSALLTSILVNGTEKARGTRTGKYAENTEQNQEVSALVFCKAGDHIEIDTFHTAGSEQTYPEQTGSANLLMVTPIAGEGKEGPENKGIETSICTAYRKASQKVPNGESKILIDTVVDDPGGNFSAAKNCIVIPTDGYYAVTGQTLVLNVHASSFCLTLIKVNGTLALNGEYYVSGNAESTSGGVVAGVLKLKKGDEVELFVYQGSGVERELTERIQANRLSVFRIGTGPEGKEGPSGGKLESTYATTKKSLAAATPIEPSATHDATVVVNMETSEEAEIQVKVGTQQIANLSTPAVGGTGYRGTMTVPVPAGKTFEWVKSIGNPSIAYSVILYK